METWWQRADNLTLSMRVTFLKQSGLIISGDPVAAESGFESLSDSEDVSGGISPDDSDRAAESESRAFEISAAMHGKRLDLALVDLVPEFSRSYLQQLIEAGAARIGDAVVTKPSSKVKAGASGVIELRPTPQSQAFKPEALEVEVVYKDEYLLVINKPVGMVVHPAPGNWSGTLLNGLLALDPMAASLPRAGIVHRLDKNTSGLMMVARTRQTMDALVEMIAQRTVSRQYLALVAKPWTGPKRRDIDAAMGRDPRNRQRMAVVDLAHSPGKTAKTTVEAIDVSQQGALVRCTLHTGRTHQIRVHMASIGLPLLGDSLYGGAQGMGLDYQALHAFRLAFAHPVTQSPLEFFAPLQPTFRTAMTQLGLRYNKISFGS